MRRITSLIALLVMIMVSAPAFAQDGCLDELKLTTFAVSQQVEEIVPNTWYLLYQNRDGGGYLVSDEVGVRAYKLPATDIEEGTFYPCKTHGKYLVRFIEAESEDEAAEYATYKLQFATGMYVGEATFDCWNGTIPQATYTDLEDEARLWNVGQFADMGEEGEYEKGHFWFTADYLGSRIDNDGFSGGKGNLSYWETGVPPTEKYNANCDWQIFAVEMQESSELDMLYTSVTARYEELMGYYDSFEVGTEHGQYPEDKVLAFQAALDEVGETLDDAAYTPTIESLQAMLDKMNNTYNDVVNSQIILVFEPADGYYFVKSATDDFYKQTTTTEDTEDPETGEIIPGETITQYFTKAMFCTPEQAGWTTFYTDSADATFLFRIDKDPETGNYKFSSAATGGRIPQISKSSGFSALDATLDPVESEVQFYYNSKDSLGNVLFAIRRADQSGEYQFLHQNLHNNGAGVTGNFCGWAQKPTASNWRLQLVSDARAKELLDAYAPIREHELLVQKYDSIKAVAQAELPIAEDFSIDKNSPLVTDASQFSSEFTEPNEGSIDALLDGDYTTFWHSNWSDGATTMGTHYLQVYLPEPQSFGIAMAYGRRSGAADDHVTVFSVYGSQTGEEATKEEWTSLGTLQYPDLVLDKMLFSSVQFEGSYSYFRVYAEETKNINTGAIKNRGYWHASEINFYPVSNNPNSQAVHMGNLYTDLKNVLTAQADLTEDQITTDVYNSLKTALDAFNTKFVNPTELRNAIATAQTKASYVVEGTDPGYWTDLSKKTALENIVTTAQTYDASGDYTPAKSQEYINQLTDGAADLMSGANSVKTDKWYQIQFPSEEMFDTYNWAKSGAELTNNDDELMTMEPLYEKVVTLGKLVSGDGSSASEGSNFPEIISADEAYQGTLLVVDDPIDLSDEDLSMFRFVAVGDSAYALQNKATGLYVNMTGTSASTLADIQPTLFKVQAIGTGVNLLKAEYLDGSDLAYLHIQHAGCKVVSWNANTLGCNSALLIREAGDITTLPGNEFVKGVEEGKIYPMCYPASFKVTGDGAQLYTVKGFGYDDDEEANTLILTPAAEAAAGQPVVLVADGDYEEAEEDEEPEYVEVKMQHGTSFVREPLTASCIVGSFKSQNAPKGYVVAKNDGLECVKSQTSVGTNSAYFAYQKDAEPADGDLVILIGGKGKLVDSIESVMNKVSATGAVYSIDGRLLLKNGNINSVRQFGKGMYIIGGVKVLVK